MRPPQTEVIRPPRPDRLIGRMCGSYRVVKLLARGGMGAVYLGEHPAIGSKVAIKVLHQRFADDPLVLERFFNEARAVNLIGHDNIVRVLDFSESGDVTYLVMEWLDGPTLEKLLHARRPLPLSRIGPIALQCCRALQAAHAHHVIHRDLKPDNIFLVKQGERDDFVKLVDFGIAKLQDAGAGKTQAGMVLGTPAYMSPEQAQAHPVDARTDIYSMGVILFQMTTGVLPFAHLSPSLVTQLHATVYDPPPRPRSLVPDVPEAWERIILKALEKDPARRYQSMVELHDAIVECLGELEITTDLPRAGAAMAALPARGGHRLLALAIGAAAGLAAAGILVLVLRPWRTPPVVTEREAPPVKPAPVSEPERAAPQPEPAPRPEPAAPQPEEQPAKKLPAPVELVRLFLVSNPPAHFEARWRRGSKQGETPAQIEVPKGSRVRVRYTREGFAPFETSLVAGAPQAVPGTLSPP